jgi:hypothetical protein
MEPTFTETQKFNKWWHYLLAGLPFILMVIAFVLVQFEMVATKDGQKDPALFICLVTLCFIFLMWFVLLTLKTNIGKNGINANFRGIPFCKRTITWEEIQSISLITYSPLSDYGGWGVRYSMSGNGWCYNVSGKDGIRIIYKNGKSFLIGTQQKEEAEKIINFYKQT